MQPRLCMAFIDGYYLRSTHKKSGQKRTISWEKVADELLRGIKHSFPALSNFPCEFARLYFFDANYNQKAKPSPHEKLERLYSEIRSTSQFDVRLGTISGSGSSFKQKGVDTQLVLEMYSHASMNHYEFGALVTGDSDFVPAVERVKSNTAARIVNFYEPKTSSRELREACDARVEMDAHFMQAISN